MKFIISDISKAPKIPMLGIAVMLFLFGPFSSDAQSYSFRHFTVNDGLPSNETYSILQNKTGEIYIGTEYGLVRYDGESFETIPFSEPNFNGSSVLNIKVDNQNKIWVGTYRYGLFYIENDTLRTFKGNKVISEIIEASMVNQFQFDNDSNIWFTVQSNSVSEYKINTYNNNLVSFSIKNQSNETIQPLYISLKGEQQTFLKIFATKSPDNEKICKLLKKPNGFEIQLPPQYYDNFGGFRAVARTCIYKTDEIWFSSKNLLFKYDRSSQKISSFDFGSEIYYVFEDEKGNVFTGCRHGAFLLRHDTEKIVPLLQNRMVRNILSDNEEGYWLATNEGLFYLPRLDIFVVNETETLNAVAMATTDETLAAINLNNQIKLFQLKDDKVIFFKQHTGKSFSNLKTIFFNQEELVIGASDIASLNVSNMKENKRIILWNTAVLDIEKGSNGNLLYACKTGFLIENDTNPETINHLHSTNLFCWAICQKGNEIFLGTDHGLYTWNEKEGAKILFPDQIRYSISDIKATSDGKIILSTRGGGIIIIDNGKLKYLNNENGLSSLLCSSIFIENDSSFWVGTNNGINRISCYQKEIKVNHWLQEDGLASGNVIDLAGMGDYLFVLTDHGISYFKPATLGSNIPKIRLELENIKIKGRIITPNDEINIKPGERDILFNFKIFGFKNKHNLQLQYTLTGNNQLIRQVAGQSIMYRDLQPGLYELKVQAIDSRNMEIGKKLVYSITIEPTFYETNWFKITIVFTFFSLIIAMIIVYFKRKEKERKRKWEYHHAQFEALNLQMNPHFLFNSLNSIQYLSYTKEHKALNRFISGLSRLLRSILDNSRDELISLASDLKNLQTYIELEVIRLEDELFHYEIVIDKKIEAEKEKIPPMLVQPIVENAIWHGLHQVKGEKELKVRYIKLDQGFKIEVEDNGIGIKKSLQQKQGNTKVKSSLGLENIKRRLKLYENMKIGKAELEIKDLSNKTGTGTLVTLTFKLSKNMLR